MTNLSHNLTESAEMYADRPALRMGDTTLTYAALDDAASRLASLVGSLGMVPGDRVGVMLPNITAFPIIIYGVLRAGGVVVPMNPLLKHAEVQYYLEDSGSGIIFAWHAVAAEAAQAAEETGATLLSRIRPGTKTGRAVQRSGLFSHVLDVERSLQGIDLRDGDEANFPKSNDVL